MELSELTLRVLLLFFPGVLCAMLVDALTVGRERTPAQFLTASFVLGMGSYLFLALGRTAWAALARLFGASAPPPVTFFGSLLEDGAVVAWREIALAAAAAVLLGAGISAALNHRLLYAAARRLRISWRTGDPDLWTSVLRVQGRRWLVVRDVGRGLVYYGWADGFSEDGATPELLLRAASVHDADTGGNLYKADILYVSFESRALAIQVLDTRDEAARTRSAPVPVAPGKGGPGNVELGADDAPARHHHRADGPGEERVAPPPAGA